MNPTGPQATSAQPDPRAGMSDEFRQELPEEIVVPLDEAIAVVTALERHLERLSEMSDDVGMGGGRRSPWTDHEVGVAASARPRRGGRRVRWLTWTRKAP